MTRSRRNADDPDAGTIAIAALSYFATEPKTMSRFFALTGLDPTTLRDAASSPTFIAGLLDFVLADERVLIAVAEAQETTPDAIVRARQALERRVGGDPVAGSVADDGWPPRPHDDWA
ncbi:DUF3572 domain-containing protein [Acuticoccus sp. I52.16.1]|uniref:DUF3572 domain-containing protein n=1 Tax=Acuticoccus sp. I52.16.1 TaxID=2928472 RepID=UPI001FD48274|nr:DUF3572 domain-containing protein [Acuticoccus sp. I52.16.1]UOM35439.1 DUF3572 domain-containing protein [Acuticoccus sp. I52.16.1]